VLFFSLGYCFVRSLYLLIRQRDRKQALYLLMLCIMSIPLLNQINLTIRFNRFLTAGALLFPCLGFFLHEMRRFRVGAAALGTLFTGLLLLNMWEYTGVASQDSIAALRYEERYLAHPRIRCYMRRGMAADINHILSFLERHARAEDLLFTDSCCPLLYFMAGKPNPTPYTDWPYYYFNSRVQQRMITDLDAVRFYVFGYFPVASIPFTEACPELAAYLRLHFTLRDATGRLLVIHERRR